MGALIEERGASFSYSAVGSNTLVQVTSSPAVLYQILVSHSGGSVGYLQIYNNGTADGTAGTPDFAIPIGAGTSGAEIPGFRNVFYGPVGRGMDGGISYLFAAGATGTVAHGVNATVDLTYRGTIT